MATSANMNLDQGSALRLYQYAWQGLPPGTVYKDPVGFKAAAKTDLRPQLKAKHYTQLKALLTTSGSTGTAGQAMVPVYLDPLTVDQERRQTPMREITPRVTNLGITADWNERTAAGGASSKLEDAALADNTDTYSRSSESIKYYYSIGRVSGPSQAAIPPGVFETYTSTTYPNAKQLETAARSVDLAIREEIDMVGATASGTYTSSSTTTDTAYDEKAALASAMDGIKAQISDENQDDQAAAAITLEDVNDMLNLCWEDGGKPSLLHTDGRTLTDIKALMVQQVRYTESTDIAWGFQTVSFNSNLGTIPMIQSQLVRATAGGGSGTLFGSKSIMALDMAMIENRILQDYTYEPLAKTNDSDKFMIKFYGTVIVRGVNTSDQTSFHGSIIDIL